MYDQATSASEKRRVAKVAGLEGFETPTIEGVEARRFQLWLTALALLLVLTSAAVALMIVPLSRWPSWLTPGMLGGGLLVLVTLFSAYAVEKELQLRRLTALLIEEKILTAALTNRIQELGALLEAGRAINLDLDLDQVLKRILDAALELLRGRDASIMLVHAQSELRTVCVAGESAAAGARLQIGEGIAGKVAESRRPLLISGQVERPRAADGTPPAPDSALSVPLIHRETILGVINVNARAERTYSEHDLRALSFFAEQAATAIAHAQLYETQRLISSKNLYQSLHDGLTNLPNRELFLDRVRRALGRRREGRDLVAVLFLDLDDFKRINDSLGHGAGDEVLITFAERLRSCVRSSDTVARFGGDEFAVLVESVRSAEDTRLTTDRITAALTEPFVVGDRKVVLRSSIGVALEVFGETSAEDLVRNADTALHVAKRQGKGAVAVFESTMYAEAVSRLQLESELHHALERQELEVFFQPIHRLEGLEAVGFEALVRWNHAVQGLLRASTFVPLAQQAGVLPEIDRWVLRQACERLREIETVFPGGDSLSVYVNLAPYRLQADELVDEVGTVLEECDLAPGRLVLEITENAVMRDPDRAAAHLRRLKGLGVRIAVDDFGTGYSSLSYFRRFPVDTVKIDRMFIDGLQRSGGEASLVEAIVRLGQSLSLEVIAEGLEEEAQIAFLRRVGCGLGQGWLLSPPLPFDELATYLRASVEGRVGAGDPEEEGEP